MGGVGSSHGLLVWGEKPGAVIFPAGSVDGATPLLGASSFLASNYPEKKPNRNDFDLHGLRQDGWWRIGGAFVSMGTFIF